MERYRYDAFGQTTVCDAGGSPRTPNESAVGNPYMFTGRRYDPESHLCYYRARMYSPALGRFLQPDPAGYIDTMNLYAYCGNNPINWIDPWGLRDEHNWNPSGRKGWNISDWENHRVGGKDHKHFKKRGKQVPWVVDEDGKLKPHDEGKYGKAKDCNKPPQDVVDEALKDASAIDIAMGALEGMANWLNNNIPEEETLNKVRDASLVVGAGAAITAGTIATGGGLIPLIEAVGGGGAAAGIIH